MSDDIDFDELSRYIEYLQRQLVTPGTEAWFDHQRVRESVNLRRATLGEGIPSHLRVEVVEDYVNAINAFRPSGSYDLASAAAIFNPLMERIVSAAKTLGLRASRVITLVTSPAIEATPYTCSTDAAHVVFAGPGTYMFCNYWAKIFTSLTTGLPVMRPKRGSLGLTAEAVAGAAKLSVYYAMTGTVMGFGVMPSPAAAIIFRGQYVEAMELFALGHELGHCVAHEADARFRELLTEETQLELELLCDRVGVATSRKASEDGTWVAFCGAGAVLMMYGHEMCQRARRLVDPASVSESRRYPSMKLRVAAVRRDVTSATPDDQLEGVVRYLDDVIALCEELSDAATEIVARALPRR